MLPFCRAFNGRSADGINPGENFVRLALVAGTEETVEAAQRIAEYSLKLSQLLAGGLVRRDGIDWPALMINV